MASDSWVRHSGSGAVPNANLPSCAVQRGITVIRKTD
jgi:hypothetical protein